VTPLVYIVGGFAGLIVLFAAGGLLICFVWAVAGAVRDWWRGRSRDLSDLVADNMARDVYAEDRPVLVAVDFADIAAANRDLDELDHALAGLYLIPTEETS
jgi:hypothetical protein